jgi:endonuclease-8
MQRSAVDGNQNRFRTIYGKAGVECPRCGQARISSRGQWDDNRLTYWCPACQR